MFLARPALAGILLLSLFVSTPTEGAEPHGWKRGQKILMAAFCRSEEAVRSIASGDASSNEAAEKAFQVEASKRNCISFDRPRFVGVVAEVLGEYQDFNNETTQILRIVSPSAPDENFYMLALKRVAQRTRYERQPMDCLNCRGA